MDEPVKEAWSDVAEGFAKLGSAMKDRYRQESDEAPGDATTSDASGEERLREAFERLLAAGRDVGQRSIDVLRDAGVNAQAKDAAASLNDALSATVAMISNEVGQWFGRNDRASATTGADEDAGQTDPGTSAASRDRLMEDAEGGVEGSLLGALDAEPEAPT